MGRPAAGPNYHFDQVLVVGLELHKTAHRRINVRRLAVESTLPCRLLCVSTCVPSFLIAAPRAPTILGSGLNSVVSVSSRLLAPSRVGQHVAIGMTTERSVTTRLKDLPVRHQPFRYCFPPRLHHLVPPANPPGPDTQLSALLCE